MDKPELLKQFQKLVDEAEHESLWGSIEVEFRRGKVTLIRKHKTVLLANNTGDPHAYPKNS